MAKSVWTIDPSHSEIGFSVKHMMFTKVSGKFNDFQAAVENDGDAFETSEISFSAEVGSINTNNVDRDNHLRSADFFDAVKFPKITFKSTGIKKINEREFEVSGNLTIKDVTKKVTLDTAYSGLMTDPWGNTKVGVAASGKINRIEFGLTWNASLETGGVLVGEDVKLVFEVQLIKQ
ncbi:YceI family protein [Parapedobacter deserti]|uniref:YceI family protein n=1 Tax=Parapedobacter deserti TaxID=1912957 RepID=A0ABV7JEU6_9SPHI